MTLEFLERNIKYENFLRVNNWRTKQETALIQIRKQLLKSVSLKQKLRRRKLHYSRKKYK